MNTKQIIMNQFSEAEKDFRIKLIRKFGNDPLVCKIATAENQEQMRSALDNFKSIRGKDSLNRIIRETFKSGK